MADKQIPALTAGTALAGTEVFHGEQGGNSRKFTATQMNAAVGTSFPGSPATGDRFYRTDRGIEYFYDGAQWLSAQLFTLNIDSPNTTAVQPKTASQSTYAGNPWSSGNVYDIFVVDFIVNSYSSTTTATNYFTHQLGKYVGGTQANIGSAISGQGNTQNVWVAQSVAIDTAYSAVNLFEVVSSETGTSSTFIMPQITYRLVG